MPSSLRKAFVGCVAVLALAACFAGCAKEGTTPTCNDNVTADGMQSDVDDPCNAFARCVVGGQVRPAAECCVDEDDQPFTGARLVSCLYGFGEVDLSSGGGTGGSGGAGTGGSGGAGTGGSGGGG